MTWMYLALCNMRVILHRLTGVKNLTIFGDGPLRSELEEQLPNAEFVGWLNGRELKQLMEESWLFLCPSVVTENNDTEGIANILKEALLMRLQVIASDVGGTSELENIILFNDWKNIQNAINHTNPSPNFKGEREIRNGYSPEYCVKLLLRGIEEYI